MIVQIKTRGDDGKYRDAFPGEFAAAALARICSFGDWSFMRHWLCVFCLKRATDCLGNSANADLWIARYRALREIA